jgi:O-methyltransferase
MSENKTTLATAMNHCGFSMIPVARLEELASIAQEVRGLSGALVECGVWNGGSAALLASAAHQPRRHVWLFDSWSGLPHPSYEDGEQARSKYESRDGKLCVGDIRQPAIAFAAAGVLDNVLHLRRGWFEDTLDKASSEIGDIAILHIDADWYASVKKCLQALYPLVVSGGLVILDDYGHWQGCRQAVDDYFADKGLTLRGIDYTSRYFFKGDA